jgi:hypothetical protein
MDSATLTKVLAGTAGMVCVMVLALTGKIDGGQASTAITSITSVFLGSTAVLASARAFASRPSAPKSQDH